MDTEKSLRDMKRLLIVTSDRSGKVDVTTSASEHFARCPYSLGAIRYNLERLGWTTCYAPVAVSGNPFGLARFIDEFRPDVIYTYGGTVALHPLLCRKWLSRHRCFLVVHGWDDVYGEIWADVFGRSPEGLWPGWKKGSLKIRRRCNLELLQSTTRPTVGWSVTIFPTEQMSLSLILLRAISS